MTTAATNLQLRLGQARGGAWNDLSTVTYTNSLFSGNSAEWGGAVEFHHDDNLITFINCTVGQNSASDVGGGLHIQGAGPGGPSTLHVTNSILWGNYDSGGAGESAQVLPASGSVTIDRTIVQGWTGGFGGTGNSGADPLFFNPSGGDGVVGTSDDDLRLRPGSPAIDAGDSSALPPDSLDLDGDGNMAERIPFDLADHVRQFDDPATADTGNGPTPIVDMGAYEFFTDCNDNGVLDSTDISMGTSHDCNGNGIPDECDIVNCSGSPACDDCNLNGVPDGCDIALGTSFDINLDGIPDECIAPAPGVNWSDNIWNLSTPDPYPNNLDPNAAANLYVTLPSTVNLFLDLTVEINSLRLQNYSTLKVTQTGAGNLSIKSPGNMLVEGDLRVANDRAIVVPVGASGNFAVTIGPGGVYHKDPTAVPATSASLSTSNVLVSDCTFPCPNGGELDLTDSMSASITGDLTIEGVSNPVVICESDGQGGVAGGHTPPIVRVKNHGYLTLGGTMALAAAANLIVDSSNVVSIGGDFQNYSTRPDCFVCSTGKFKMNGTSPQVFEVAATDVGTLPDLSTAQYVIGDLEIAGGADVTFRDSFDNDAAGQGACTEALYLDTLVLDAGSSITVDNCHVYFQTLVRDPSASVTMLGCADLQQVSCPFTQPATPEPNPIAKNRYISFLPSNSGMQSSLRVTMVSLQHPDPPNLPQFPPHDFSAIEGQVRWVGTPVNCTETENPPTTFKCAALQCTPQYLDWPAATGGQALHVTGAGIMPSSSYRVEAIAQPCDINQPFNYSAPLTIATARWGDVAAAFQAPSPAPLTQPNITDVAACVDKFKAVPTAIIVARADVNPALPNGRVDIADVANIVDAFKNLAYSVAGPTNCP